MKRIVALLLVCVFVVLALASCGVKAEDLEGKKFEVTKVSVKLTKEGKENAEKLGMDVDDIKAIYENRTFEFSKLGKGTAWSVKDNTVRYGLEEFELKSGKLVIKNDDGTIKLTIKEVK